MFERFHLIWVINLRKRSTYLHPHGFMKFLALPLQNVCDSTLLLCHLPKKICQSKRNKLSVAFKIKGPCETLDSPPQYLIGCFSIPEWHKRKQLQGWGGEEAQGGVLPLQDELEKRRQGGHPGCCQPGGLCRW